MDHIYSRGERLLFWIELLMEDPNEGQRVALHDDLRSHISGTQEYTYNTVTN